MKRLLQSILTLSVLIMFPLSAAAEGLKVGYVNLQEALITSDAGKSARDLFKAEVDRIQKDLDFKQEELNKLKEDLEKQGFLLSDEAKAEKEREYQNKLKIVQRFYQDSQEKLQGKDARLTSTILTDMRKVISRLGEDEGYTIILESNEGNILYAQKSANLTAEVVKRLNEVRKK